MVKVQKLSLSLPCSYWSTRVPSRIWLPENGTQHHHFPNVTESSPSDLTSKLLSRLSWGNIHSVGKAWSSAEKSDDFLCGCQYVYIMGKFGRLRQCFSGGLLLWRSLVITRVPLSHLISHRFSFPINQCHDIKWTLLDQQSVCITLNIQAFPIVCYSCPLHQSKHHVWRCHCFRLAQLSTTSCVNHSKYVTLLDGSVDILFLW